MSETVRSMTSPLKDTVGMAFPTALFLRVNHRACALLGLISDSVSWHKRDTVSSCSRTAVTAVWMSLSVLQSSLSSASVSTWLKPLGIRQIEKSDACVFACLHESF